MRGLPLTNKNNVSKRHSIACRCMSSSLPRAVGCKNKGKTPESLTKHWQKTNYKELKPSHSVLLFFLRGCLKPSDVLGLLYACTHAWCYPTLAYWRVGMHLPLHTCLTLCYTGLVYACTHASCYTAYVFFMLADILGRGWGCDVNAQLHYAHAWRYATFPGIETNGSGYAPPCQQWNSKSEITKWNWEMLTRLQAHAATGGTMFM